MPEPIVLHKNSDVEVRIPTRFEVCSRCRGEGTHDAWEGGMTAEEMHEQGDEFLDDYMAGAYSVPCTVCAGKRVIAVADEQLCSPEQLASWIEHETAEADYRAEAEMERRAGC